MKKVLVILLITVFSLSHVTGAVFAANDKAHDEKNPHQATNTQPQPPAPSPTDTQPAVSPSPVQPSPVQPAPVVSPTPSPVQGTSSQPQQPVVTPTPVVAGNTDNSPQKGGGPKNDTSSNSSPQDSANDTSNTQTLQDVTTVTSDAPVELSVHAIPAPFVDEAPQDLPKPDPSDVATPVTQPKPTQTKTPPIAAIIHAPIDLLTGGQHPYYQSSQLSQPMTNNLLGLGAFLILLSLFLIRPRVIWGRFIGINYLQPRKNRGYPLLDRDINRLNDVDMSNSDENVIFHRLSF